MTAILGFEVEGNPCMLGDLLLQRDISPDDPSFPIPVTGVPAGEQPIRWGHGYVNGLSQKLIQITEHLIVAWSGSRRQASDFICKLRSMCKEAAPTSMPDYEQIFARLQPGAYPDLHILITFACDDGWRAKQFQCETAHLEDERIVAVGGSGSYRLQECFEHETSHRAPDAFNRSVGKLMLAASRMWFWDITGEATEMGFGGGYEVATRMNNRMTKIGNVLFSNFVYLPDRGIGSIGIFKKIDYVDDTLILRILDVRTDPETHTSRVNRAVAYMIPALGRPPMTEAEKASTMDRVPEFQPDHFVTHIKINSVDENREPHSASLHFCDVERSSPQIVFEQSETGEFVSIHLTEGYLQAVIDETRGVLEEAGEEFSEG